MDKLQILCYHEYNVNFPNRGIPRDTLSWRLAMDDNVNSVFPTIHYVDIPVIHTTSGTSWTSYNSFSFHEYNVHFLIVEYLVIYYYLHVSLLLLYYENVITVFPCIMYVAISVKHTLPSTRTWYSYFVFPRIMSISLIMEYLALHFLTFSYHG